MSSEAREDLPAVGHWEELKEAAERLRRARHEYDKFVNTTPLNVADVPLHSMEKMKAADTELQDAEEAFHQLYQKRLQMDPEFAKRSSAAEERLSDGPPWDDAFSPSKLLNESGQS